MADSPFAQKVELLNLPSFTFSSNLAHFMPQPDYAVIFDLDGTLLDTLNDLAASGNEVLSTRGLSVHSADAYRNFIGHGMVNLVKRIFPPDHQPRDEAEVEQLLAEYRAAYAKRWKDTTTLFPGVEGLLDELAGLQIPIAVLSNKAHDFTLQCVRHFLGNWDWKAVYGVRENAGKKPDPTGALSAAAEMRVTPDRCWFVGDSDVDMLTAQNANMIPVGVSWGFRGVEELRGAGAAEILEHPNDLLQILG